MRLVSQIFGFGRTPCEHDLFQEFKLPGLQSVKSEHIDKSTLEIVSAGDQLSFRISKHITP